MNRCFMLSHPECIMAVKSKRATRPRICYPLHVTKNRESIKLENIRGVLPVFDNDDPARFASVHSAHPT